MGVAAKLGEREKRHRFAQVADALVGVAQDGGLPGGQGAGILRGCLAATHADVPVEPGERGLTPLQDGAQRRVALFDKAIEPLQPGVVAALGGLQHCHELRDGETAQRIILCPPIGGELKIFEISAWFHVR